MMHKRSKVEFHPLGVIGAIVSWNYPSHNILNPMLAAIFSGNGVVVSEHASWSGCFYVRIVQAALAVVGAPENLVHVITGFAEIGEALVSSVDTIIFVGSLGVGKMIMRSASETLIPVTLELGGKDAFIVCEDLDVPHVWSLSLLKILAWLEIVELISEVKGLHNIKISVFYDLFHIGESFSHPKDFPSQLASAVYAQADLFMTYIHTDVLSGFSLEILQPGLIIWDFLRSHTFGCGEEENSYLFAIPYYRVIPFVSVSMLIGMVYAVIAPLLLPFLIGYFYLGYVVYVNQEQSEVRFCAVRWATSLFDLDHCPSRFICMVGVVGPKMDIRW